MAVDRRTLMAGALAAGLAGKAAAQGGGGVSTMQSTIALWHGGVPGLPARPPVETVEQRSQDPALPDRSMYGIGAPRMNVFKPARANGGAVLIIPGGGYARVVFDKEGHELARRFTARGVAAFVLLYRLPGEGWANQADVPLADAQRAMRLIRHNAPSYGIDPKRIGAVGFSAGGHLCADLATRFDRPVYAPFDAADRQPARPDAAAPIYPVISMAAPVTHAGSRRNLLGETASPERERAYSAHLNVGEGGPPIFLCHAEDDAAVPVENSLLMREACKAKRVPVETHLFPDGGHGFGLRAEGKSVYGWEKLLIGWGEKRGIF